MPNENDAKPTLWSLAGIRPLWLIIAAIVVVSLFLGYRWGGKRYSAHQLQNLIAQARTAEANGDSRSALVSLRRVLQLDPDNVEAIRMLALQADRFNSPSALQWMQKLAELEPGNVTNLVLWARCAIRQGDLITADQVLLRFPKEQKESLTYHRLAGAFAIKVRKFPAAEYHFAKAHKLNPADPVEQLNLATIRLLSSKPEFVRESRATLEGLITHPQVGRDAAHALLADQLRTKNTSRQLELARQIMNLPGATLNDRLTYLDLLRRNKDSRFPVELAEAKKTALKHSGSMAEMVAWMNARDLASEAYAWGKSLPEKDQALPATSTAMAETLVRLKKWDELLAKTSKANWHELEFLRYAFLARAQRELNLWGSSRSNWRQAVIACGMDTHSRSFLAQMVQGWEWYAEAEEIWWALSRLDAGRIPALRALYKIYIATGNSRSLLKVTETISDLNPEDPVIKNNFAMLSLLLGQNLPKAKELARSNYEKHPNDPAAISTYAFSLREEGRLAEAVALMDKLPGPTKNQPEIAGYWGILLSDAGRTREARPFLEAGLKVENLMPEERELMKNALDKIK